MVVTCDNCGAKYNVDEDKIKGRGARITCKKCSHVFAVYLKEPEKPEEAIEEIEPEESVDDLDVNDLDFKTVGITSWKVKVKIGLVYDFSDYKTLSKYIREGKVANTDLLSHDGKEWKAIDQIDDLKRHFCATYLMAKKQMSIQKDTEESAAEEKKVKKISGGEGLSDLASVIAEAEAEVQGRAPIPSYQSKASPTRKRPKPPAESKPINMMPILGVVALIMIGFVIWKMLPSEEAVQAPAATDNTQKKSKPNADLAAYSQDIKAKAAKQNAEDEEKERLAALKKEREEQRNKRRKAKKGQIDKQGKDPNVLNTVDHLVLGAKALKSKKWKTAKDNYSKATTDGNPTKVAEQNRGWGIALYHIGKSRLERNSSLDKDNLFSKAIKKLEAAKRNQRLLEKNDVAKYLGYIYQIYGDEGTANNYIDAYNSGKSAREKKEIKRTMQKLRNLQ